jgi:hypothetical protein
MAENNVMALPHPAELSLAARFLHAPSAHMHHAIVEVSGSPFPPLINASDLVCVDFTCTRLKDNALYVVILDGGSPTQWIGIRRFTNTENGWFMSDDSSGSAPYPVAGPALSNLKVVGRVKDVFKAGGLSS